MRHSASRTSISASTESRPSFVSSSKRVPCSRQFRQRPRPTRDVAPHLWQTLMLASIRTESKPRALIEIPMQPQERRRGSAALHQHPAIFPLFALLPRAKALDNALATREGAVLPNLLKHRASSKVFR